MRWEEVGRGGGGSEMGGGGRGKSGKKEGGGKKVHRIKVGRGGWGRK